MLGEYKQYSELQHVALLCKQRDATLLNRACKVLCSDLVPSLILVPAGLFLWSQ